ncbi:MAG: hypothetical protein ACYCXN_15850 [Acidimicrobiales bacterium]
MVEHELAPQLPFGMFADVTYTTAGFDLAGASGIAPEAPGCSWGGFFQKFALPARLSSSGARDSLADVVVPRYGLYRRQEAGRQDVLLLGGVRPGGRQTPYRLPALPGLGRGDRPAAFRVRPR